MLIANKERILSSSAMDKGVLGAPSSTKRNEVFQRIFGAQASMRSDCREGCFWNKPLRIRQLVSSDGGINQLRGFVGASSGKPPMIRGVRPTWDKVLLARLASPRSTRLPLL